MTAPRPQFIFAFLLALCFTLSTWLEPHLASTDQTEVGAEGLLKSLLGDGRRLFANHFFVKADIYFHSGYYPSIFEQARRAQIDTKHMMEDHHDHDGKDDHDEEEHEKAMDFLGQPKDWIDRFGRHFYPSTHSHLDKPGEAKEILPWLRLSAELDPTQIDTYIVGSYWLRKHLGKTADAEDFLRQGLRANPTSYAILFELGSLYYENRHQPERARNLWELALRRWHEQDKAGKNPDKLTCDEILANLAHLEEEQDHLSKALAYLEEEAEYSPAPDGIKKHITELKEQLQARPQK